MSQRPARLRCQQYTAAIPGIQGYVPADLHMPLCAVFAEVIALPRRLVSQSPGLQGSAWKKNHWPISADVQVAGVGLSREDVLFAS